MKKKPIFLSLAVAILFASCKNDNDDNINEISSEGVEITTLTDSKSTAEGGTQTATNAEDLLENNTFTSVVKITYSQGDVTIVNPLETSGVTITKIGSDVVIKSTAKEVEYQLSGASQNGSFKIYSDKKFKLTLNGVSLTNDNAPAINIQSGKAFVVLNEGTTNSFSDSSDYLLVNNENGETEDAKATVFSNDKLIFSGKGTLNVTGNYKHAIASDDYVRVIDGAINVLKSVSDAIHTNDGFFGVGGTLSLSAGSDAIEVEKGGIVIDDGNYTIKSAGDGIAASYDTDTTYDPFVTINGGSFVIDASEEGIESKSTLTLNGGKFTINTIDDGLNATSAIYINGGEIYINATTNDAIDTNGIFVVTGGRTIAFGGRNPETGIDIDRGKTFKITGGTLIAAGNRPPNDNGTPTAETTQPSLVLSSLSVSSGAVCNIQSSDGNEVVTFKTPKAFSYLIFSSAKLLQGKNYNVYTGGNVSNATETNGLYTSGTYSGGTQRLSFTTNSVVTTR